MANRRLF